MTTAQTKKAPSAATPEAFKHPSSEELHSMNKSATGSADCRAVGSGRVVPFSFESTEVRTLLIGDQPWFFAMDVCASLALRDTNKALLNLDEDEKCEHEQYSGSGRKPILINESGLYSLVLRSRKPEAKRFKKWVTNEVLPAIRKTGAYGTPGHQPEPMAAIFAAMAGHQVSTSRFMLTIEDGQLKSVTDVTHKALVDQEAVHRIKRDLNGLVQRLRVLQGEENPEILRDPLFGDGGSVVWGREVSDG
ncbi:BRO-N domain-containing protein [Arhodomonas sp. AD133]|uniref:BRO-N domain-containing protein n=1 Tax=Arhodomonas sp. AD133 TaxID=3415009 RepID=UPI003EBEF637